MICPYLSGLHKGKVVKIDCLKHECAKYVNVVGVNPQTGQEVNDWNCSDAWTPILLVENSQAQRQTGAAVESFRNEMTSDNRKVLSLVYNNQAGIECS